MTNLFSVPPTRPLTGCLRRWAWLMPQTAVETFRVGQKPRAYRASRAQGRGGDSRDKFLRCRDRIWGHDKNWRGSEAGPKMPGCTKFWPKLHFLIKKCKWPKKKYQLRALHTWIGYITICLYSLAPGSLPSLYYVESRMKVKQRQVDRLNKTPLEFNDQGLGNFPLCGNIATAQLNVTHKMKAAKCTTQSESS